MKFNYFHLMPWDRFPERVEPWPVANREFDPVAATEVYKTYIDTMVFAEECGWDGVGCNEHHFSPYGLMSNCNIIGSILATRTKRVKINMFGNLVPLLNPIRIAEEYAMLDVISGGRLQCGMMRGIPHEYIAYNVAPDESLGRVNEAIKLIKKAWTEPKPFGWEGEYYQFRSISIWPRPRQQPHPPILMSGNNPDSARNAARNRAMLGLVFIPSLAAGRAIIEAYIDEARKCGWEPTPEHILCGFQTCIAETEEEAKQTLERGIHYFTHVLMAPQHQAQKMVLTKTRYFAHAQGGGENFVRRLETMGTRTIDDMLAAGTVFCGTPETVVKQMRRAHAELGCGWFNTNMKIGNVPNDKVTRSMELFRDHVQAEVRDLGRTREPMAAVAGE